MIQNLQELEIHPKKHRGNRNSSESRDTQSTDLPKNRTQKKKKEKRKTSLLSDMTAKTLVA